MAEFLLEVGLEEIPARMIAAAEQELATRLRDLVTRERLVAADLVVRTYSTPRRLAVHISGLADSQADTKEMMTGPSWAVAFKEGAPMPAALAFAKKAGVAVEVLQKITTPKGDYVSATVLQAGRTAGEVLAAGLQKEISALSWPKNMYWRPGKPERYVRPVQWLVALLDDDIVPVEFAGIHSANLTYGHRILHGLQAVRITHPHDYLSALESVKVMADVAARRHTIRKALDHATRTVTNARWREDEGLLEAVVHLAEWPSVVLGRFEPEYLALPEEVLVTVMRDHQKYFAVEDAPGKLAPYFLAVLNTQADPEGIIRHGNERVLRARFNDARFFWNFDQKIPLDDRVELLKSVTFHKGLGDYYQKSERTLGIAKLLERFHRGRADLQHLERAIRLSKVDLTTELVKEFTELQGIVGGLYARVAGEAESVASAIYDQYKPASATDTIPQTIEGQLLGLADRLGTIVDMFALGLMPTGSKDPYALRRAANGVVAILARSKSPLRVSNLVATGISSKGEKEQQTQLASSLSLFFHERLEFYLREVEDFSFDVVNAVLASGADDVADAVTRAHHIHQIRNSENFAAIAAAFKRSKNLLRQAAEKGYTPAPFLDVTVLVDEAELSLHELLKAMAPQVETYRTQRNYGQALRSIATLRTPIDRFFDTVMVMVEEPVLRANRLALLDRIVRDFGKIADFSEIVFAGAP